MLTQGLSGEDYVKASKELADIEPVVARIGDLRAAEHAQHDAEALLEDPELRELAEAELRELKERIPALEYEIRVALLPKDAMDERNVILEIRGEFILSIALELSLIKLVLQIVTLFLDLHQFFLIAEGVEGSLPLVFCEFGENVAS